MYGAGKNGKIGVEIAAVVFSLLTAFISIGAMAGSFYKLNIKALGSCSAGSAEFFPLYSLTVLDGQTTKANYADECKYKTLSEALCALQKNAANNGSAAVRCVALPPPPPHTHMPLPSPSPFLPLTPNVCPPPLRTLLYLLGGHVRGGTVSFSRFCSVYSAARGAPAQHVAGSLQCPWVVSPRAQAVLHSRRGGSDL